MFPKDFLDKDEILKTLQRAIAARQEAANRHREMVESLDDMEFAGLLMVVNESRDYRLAKMQRENPLLNEIRDASQRHF